MSDSSITVAELEILHREKALNPLLVTAWEGETNIDHILRSIRLYPESWRRFCILGTATIIFALLAIFFGLLKGPVYSELFAMSIACGMFVGFIWCVGAILHLSKWKRIKGFLDDYCDLLTFIKCRSGEIAYETMDQLMGRVSGEMCELVLHFTNARDNMQSNPADSGDKKTFDLMLAQVNKTYNLCVKFRLIVNPKLGYKRFVLTVDTAKAAANTTAA